MKCLITLILISVSITSGQINIYDYLQKRTELSKGDTVRITDLVKNRMLILMLLFSLPANGQIIMTGDKGYVPSAGDNTAPSIPTNIHAEPISDDSMRFFWTNPPEADFLKNYVKLNGSLRDSTENDTIIFGGLVYNSFNYIHLAAEDVRYNMSSYSDSVGATTYDTTARQDTLPASLTGLTVTDSLDSIKLSWINNPPNAIRIIIQKDSADYDTVLYPTATWVDSNAMEGVYSGYRIYPENNAGSADTTDEITTELVRSDTKYFSLAGNNSWSGTNPNASWLPTKFNTLSLELGHRYLLLAGDTVTTGGWIIGNSGTSGNEITIGAYGDTATNGKPVISLRTELPGWDTEGNWTEYNHTYNIWLFTAMPSGTYDLRGSMWFNGLYYKRAYNIVPQDNYPYDSLAFVRTDLGTYPGIDAEYRSNWTNSTKSLYVYATSNPATFYSNIEVPFHTGGSDATRINCIYANGKDYIIIDGLSFEGGYIQLRLDGCSHWKIRNCNFLYSCQQGIRMENNGSVESDSNEVYNNVFDSKHTELVQGAYDWYGGSSFLSNMQGVMMFNGANYNRVHDDIIRDFPNADVCVLGNDGSSYSANCNYIYDNDLLFTGKSGRGFEIFQSTTAYDKVIGNILVNNYISQRMDSHIGGDSTIVAYNIYLDSAEAPELYGGFGEGSERTKGIRYSYVGHNTFYNMYSYGLYGYEGWRYTNMENNIFINCDRKESGAKAIRDNLTTSNIYQVYRNNYFYYTGNPTNMINYNGTNMSVSSFNTADAKRDTISGNVQFTGTLSDLITVSDFSIPVGSPLLSASYALPLWVKQHLINIYDGDFVRMDGTKVVESSDTSQTNTDIGPGGQ